MSVHCNLKRNISNNMLLKVKLEFNFLGIYLINPFNCYRIQSLFTPTTTYGIHKKFRLIENLGKNAHSRHPELGSPLDL